MVIILSEIWNESVNPDGSRLITERHTFDDGHIQPHTYTAAATLDIDAVLVARAANINAEYARRADVLAAAMDFEIPLTKTDVIKRITPAEWNAFQVSTDTDVCYFRAAFVTTDYIYRSDLLTQQGFGLLELVGILAAGRSAEILA